MPRDTHPPARALPPVAVRPEWDARLAAIPAVRRPVHVRTLLGRQADAIRPFRAACEEERGVIDPPAGLVLGLLFWGSVLAVSAAWAVILGRLVTKGIAIAAATAMQAAEWGPW